MPKDKKRGNKKKSPLFYHVKWLRRAGHLELNFICLSTHPSIRPSIHPCMSESFCLSIHYIPDIGLGLQLSILTDKQSITSLVLTENATVISMRDSSHCHLGLFDRRIPKPAHIFVISPVVSKSSSN